LGFRIAVILQVVVSLLSSQRPLTPQSPMVRICSSAILT
jgi:hypothetical protein